jgi:geranylgeranyl diphosphate synthase type I
MVKRKTAALIAASTELGSMVANVKPQIQAQYREFGELLGLAFQVQDDILGIWGDTAITGKSVQSDLLSGKKSFPVLWGLNQAGPFAKRWYQGNIQPDELEELVDLLSNEGAYDQAQQISEELTDRALRVLDEVIEASDSGAALRALAERLLKRQE